MHKRKKGRKFSRERDVRNAFLRELAASFFRNRRITTTEARAKELRSLLERLLTYEKRGGIANRRRVAAFIGSPVELEITKRIAPGLEKRPGGYTKLTKLGPRKSDSAKMAVIELATTA